MELLWWFFKLLTSLMLIFSVSVQASQFLSFTVKISLLMLVLQIYLLKSLDQDFSTMVSKKVARGFPRLCVIMYLLLCVWSLPMSNKTKIIKATITVLVLNVLYEIRVHIRTLGVGLWPNAGKNGLKLQIDLGNQLFT